MLTLNTIHLIIYFNRYQTSRENTLFHPVIAAKKKALRTPDRVTKPEILNFENVLLGNGRRWHLFFDAA